MSIILAGPNNQSWLLDFAHDTAIKLTKGQFCLGWVPGTDTLILSPSYRADADVEQAHPLSAAQLVGATLSPPVTLTTPDGEPWKTNGAKPKT